MTTYKTNTVANYTTLLPNRIELEGEWEVGLVDLSYPASWYNVGKGEWFKVEAMSGPIAETGGLVDVGEGKMRVSEGRYESGKDLIETIKWQWHEYWDRVKKEMRQINTGGQDKAKVPPGHRLHPVEQNSFEREDVAFTPNVTATSLQVNFNEKTNKARFRVFSSRHYVSFSPKLANILAIDVENWSTPNNRWITNFNRIYESETEVDVDRGYHTLFVYCSIVQDSVVGDVRAPLLRTSTVRGKYGEMVREVFTRPLYIPLKTNSFDNVEIAIKSETGDLIPFNYGNSCVTLHFRRVRPF